MSECVSVCVREWMRVSPCCVLYVLMFDRQQGVWLTLLCFNETGRKEVAYIAYTLPYYNVPTIQLLNISLLYALHFKLFKGIVHKQYKLYIVLNSLGSQWPQKKFSVEWR